MILNRPLIASGDKLGFLEATVEMALKRDDLKEDFLAYLKKQLALQ